MAAQSSHVMKAVMNMINVISYLCITVQSHKDSQTCSEDHRYDQLQP